MPKFPGHIFRISPLLALIALTSLLTACDPLGSGGVNQTLIDIPLLPRSQEKNKTPSFHQAGGGLMTPARMVRTPGNKLLVADHKRRSLLRIDPETLLPDQSLYIQGGALSVAMVGGEILAGVKDTESIDVFDHEGRVIAPLVAQGGIGHPVDIAVDPLRWIVFALDSKNREVLVLDHEKRKLLGTIGKGDLSSPSAVAVDMTSFQIFVSDYGGGKESASVKVFSYARGDFGTSLGFISGDGRFSRPNGLTIAGGQLFVTDIMLGQVMVFDLATRDLVGTLGNPDWEDRTLRSPTDVVVMDNDDVIVTTPTVGKLVAFPGGLP